MRWLYLGAFVVSVPFGITEFMNSPLVMNHASTPILIALFIAIFQTAISYLLLSYAMKSLSTTVISMYNYAILIIASAVAIMIGQATLRWDESIAAVLVIVGAYFVNTQNRKNSNINKNQNHF